ncbi:MAG: DUF1697 domain-containing protein [Acidobacteria bacterium]|nr:DUF1697 domain-containing protein [Acidobacteriota bacterium]
MRYVALPRGINVSGANMIKMSDLKAAFESLGFENVVTYINSGNLAFDTKKTAETTLIKKAAAILASLTGRPIPVMVREQTYIERIILNNPFAGQFESHKEMHVLFLNEELTKEGKLFLAENVPPPERFSVSGREIYCHLPMGVADSYLGRGTFERKLKIAVTARNWRTVEKLAAL